ncbi:hypothetical protein UlMin_007909 [Ulmus minor]
MKKKAELEVDDHQFEIIKAVAQAWYSHSSSCSRTMSEFDAHKRNFKGKPSRFKLEAIGKKSGGGSATSTWDFRQSLWDSYEIVTVSKRLEYGLVLDNPFSEIDDSVGVHKRRRESKNSLRSLFNQMSSRRFNQAKIPKNSDL